MDRNVVLIDMVGIGVEDGIEEAEAGHLSSVEFDDTECGAYGAGTSRAKCLFQ